MSAKPIPLPEPAAHMLYPPDVPLFTADQLRAHEAAVRQAIHDEIAGLVVTKNASRFGWQHRYYTEDMTDLRTQAAAIALGTAAVKVEGGEG